MQAIFNRRSIRKYTDKKVPEEMIEQILRAGMAAPSAGNSQPWHFIVVDDRNILNEITKVHPYSKMLNEASHAIIVCGDRSLQKYEGYWVQDCSAAMENMLIMAQDIGLGAVWLGVYPNEERVKAISEIFGLPENVTPLSIMSLGYPAETKEPANRFNPSRVHRNRW
ncbi:nitroreductase family protein [Clostridium thermosuccinogenes]|uniref:Nitroreductase family protein n=1 Tax=Clostridium thermosuccinogenes TaxID=84032 RepID=A0A2K2FC21_9CLOT|nr:nitroreductase family protein [Pseudoclostridium thermosuccinogenes]AUS96697.1 nitroreductase family protein [Pseudoclostridium thermosuccinogenes]PNT96317.1 nitroreductase family protein [Pseudoclostridium thermosuccinogenes]PNT97524.1 nitroreductase family protein [Pseudoclostridium thermosuccinogenes]